VGTALGIRHGTHRAAVRASRPRAAGPKLERPLWQTIGLLYASLVLIVAFVITLVFVVASLVAGGTH
jgi:hypothetical protein